MAESEGISAMPTFKLFKNGSKAKEIVGASEAKIKEALEEVVAWTLYLIFLQKVLYNCVNLYKSYIISI